MLTPEEAVKQAQILGQHQMRERNQLDVVRRYWKGLQKLPAIIPGTAPREVKTMARIARVNICPIVVDSLAQSVFVEGFRNPKVSPVPNEAGGYSDKLWEVWQANKMDARQTGIHRAAFAYGTAYAVVLPGDPVPVIRGLSPRSMTALYGDDPDWPTYALERGISGRAYRLYDDEYVYFLGSSDARGDSFEFVSVKAHNAGVTPVVRYLDEDDLDADDEVKPGFGDHNWEPVPTRGQVAPLMALQDQIDLTTFGLLVAQWYSAFRQRYVIGWVPDDEAQMMKAGASQIWTFEDGADTADGSGSVKVGEFAQTDLDGYISSREASMRHVATLSQTPVHELLGQLVNLSAEALAAAEAGRDRKVDERKTLLGESHEQTLRLAGDLGGFTVQEGAEVVWRDTSARTFAATVDGLGKLAQMLGIPAQELWDRVPDATQQDVERWKAAAQNGDAFTQLQQTLERQAAMPGTFPSAA